MLVLFDIDGTLLRGKGLGRPVTERTIAEVFGVEIDLELHWFGGKTDWFSLIELLEPLGFSPEEIGNRLPEYMLSKARHMTELMQTIPSWALPGALETVNALRERPEITLGVLTGNVETTALLKLAAVGFDPAWFPVRAFGHEAISRNDLPPIAMERAYQLSGRRFAAHEVWIVGDTVADIECARAHGLKVAAVTTGFQPRADLIASSPDALLESLTEFLDLV
jgi:phosphoglycolate phosphatase-like HAD superfamily hydrolase